MQALGPIENPIEHNFSRTEVAHVIDLDDFYSKTYGELFGELPDFSDYDRFPIPSMPSKHNEEADENWKSMKEEDQMKVNRVFANVGKVLAAFQMSLVSQKTNFDVFVQGLKENDPEKTQALSTDAQRGLKVFIGKGKCIDCHLGPTFTDSKFHNTLLPDTGVDLGFKEGRHGGIEDVKNSIFNAAGPYSDAPKGEVAKRLKNLNPENKDRNGFKTPGLRNVFYTHPYMHTGQFKDLQAVIEFYSEMTSSQSSDSPEIQPKHFTQQEKSDLLEFLKSLSSYYR
jgi:cytochrome c peroxidase